MLAQQPPVTVTLRLNLPGTSTSGGAGTIDKYLSPHALAFITGVQNPTFSPQAQ